MEKLTVADGHDQVGVKYCKTLFCQEAMLPPLTAFHETLPMRDFRHLKGCLIPSSDKTHHSRSITV